MKEQLTEAKPVMKVMSITLTSERAPQFIDITGDLQRLVDESGVKEGVATVFSRHTTASIRINENEPLLLKDMEDFLKRLVPRDVYYRHNDFSIRTENMTEDECPNGHAHCQHLLLGSSECVPIVNGKLSLGRWQRVFFVELDRPREREVLVHIQGWA